MKTGLLHPHNMQDIKIRLPELKDKAKSRPEGYYDKVVSMGRIDRDVLILTPKAYSDLLKIYNPASVLPAQGSCCGKRTSPSPMPKSLPTPKPPPMPPLMTQAKNAASAVGRVISNVINRNPLKAPDDIIASRKEVCAACEFWVKDKERCSKCGCYTRIKLTLSSERCPIGKWEKVS